MARVSSHTERRLDDFWSREIGCAPGDLAADQRLIVSFASKDGTEFVRVFRRREAEIITCSPPLSAAVALAAAKPHRPSDDRAFLADTLAGGLERLIGPVFLGYVDEPLPVEMGLYARMLGSWDDPALERLRTGATAHDWEYSGITPTQPIAGCFDGDELVSVAGYEVWGGLVAHIGVVTSVSSRGRGFGRSAVCCIANHAIGEGLVAQYQTLLDNAPSMGIARHLGFEPYATFTYAVARQSN